MKQIFFAAVLACTATVALANEQCKPVDLRSEAMQNPIGIDVAKPRFSWKMEDVRRGAVQRAYQVQVASSAEALESGKADLWDSGKVESNASFEIEYAGAPLKPLTAYYWRVNLWDMEGNETGYTKAATVETGFMDKANWKAQWIAAPYKEDKPDDVLKDLSWIWYPEGDPVKRAPGGEVYFRAEVDVPADSPVASASSWGLADNHARIYINGTLAHQVIGFKGAVGEDVKKLIKPGKNLLQVAVMNGSSGPAGLALGLDIKLLNGRNILAVTNGEWKASKVSGAQWPENGSGTADWKDAKELGKVGMKPWDKPNIATKGGPASIHRKEFGAAAAPVSARLYITALGSYRAEINGQRVGNDILTPEWTDYRDRLIYQTYDVTSLVKTGDNALGVTLGDGWYATALGWGLQRWCFGDAPTRFMAELHVKYPDGKEDVIVTDDSWKYSESAIRRSEIYAGETYDARLEQAGWSSPGFDDAKWKQVLLPATDTSKVILEGQSCPPVRVMQEIKPIAVTEPAKDTFVVDMGQNMVGWAQIKVKGKAGDTVKMRFAEILNPDGTVYTTNLRRAEATDYYTLKGDGEEVYEPHFTYHGFRYIEVTGFPGGAPTKDAIVGKVFYTGVEAAGKFESSVPLVDQIVKNTMWGLRGNLVSVPTDCPQRDERLGWTGDAQAIWKTACYNLDIESFTEKWSRDLIDSQGEKGDFPNVAPRVISTEPGAPAWGDAGIIVPYDGWKFYGNRRNMEAMWTPMERWMKYIYEENTNYIWEKRRGNDYGDWVPANSETDKTLIATAYWAGNARRMAEIATALGKPEKAQEYTQVYENIKKAFQQRFIAPDGKIANGSQTCYVLALDNDLVQPDMVDKAVTHLVDDITSRGNHLSTGFLGSTYLMHVLSKHGKNDVAVTLLLNKTYPSWGYMIEKGATTIWERWNSDTGDPSMNSFNHYTYGAVTDWLYGHFCGIRPVTPGFGELVIEPHPDKRVEWAKATYNSTRGDIISEWKHTGAGLELNIEIPANSKGVISLPVEDAARVTEGGKSLEEAGLKVAATENGRAKLNAGAGQYQFLIKN